MNTNSPIGIPFLDAQKSAAREWAAGREVSGSVTFLTDELGIVDFNADGSAVIHSDRHGFTIPAAVSPLWIKAAQAIRDGYARFGVHELGCDCGHGEVVVDALASSADVAKLAEVIEHALYDHATRRDVIATVHTAVITPADFGL